MGEKIVEKYKIWNGTGNYLHAYEEETGHHESLKKEGFELSTAWGWSHADISLWENYEDEIFLVELVEYGQPVFSFACEGQQDAMECVTKAARLLESLEKVEGLDEDDREGP